jgi:hypothetical protein
LSHPDRQQRIRYNETFMSAIVNSFWKSSRISRPGRRRFKGEDAKATERLETQGHGGSALRAQPEVRGLSLRSFVKMIGVLIDSRNRNGCDFELKEAAFRQRTQSASAARIGALGNHQFTDTKLSATEPQYSLCCIS